MNCEYARDLLDDYLDNQLGRYERQRLETHLASCSRCVKELHARSSFEQAIWQTLASSVRHQTLSPEASGQIVRAAQGSVRYGVWSNYALLTLRGAATLAMAALVLVGILFLLERAPEPIGTHPVTLPPVVRLALSELSLGNPDPTKQPTLGEIQPANLSPTNRPALSLTAGDLRIEPKALDPGERFTVTVIIHSELAQPVETARFDLEVTGPRGRYNFPLAVEGPLPAPGIAVVQVTPDNLDRLSQKQYLVSADDLFEAPGIYTVRVTLYSPVLAPRQ